MLTAKIRICLCCVNCLLLLRPAAAYAEPVELAVGVTADRPQQPQLAVDQQGVIHVVFGVADTVRYRRSDDGGVSFSSTVSMPAVPNMSLGMRRGPRLAATDSSICVTVIGGKQGKGRDGDVLAFRSADAGTTWAGPVSVNDFDDSAREGLHAMASGPRGELCCVWLDLRNRQTEVMAAISLDGGASWSKNVLVYRSPDGSVCECCHPSVVFDEKGHLHVMFRNSLAGARDIYLASSPDRGKSFGGASKVGSGTWPLKACPMDGGATAALDSGKIACVWRRDKSIFLTLSNHAAERLLGPGEQPWIAASNHGPFVVWLEKRAGAAYLLSPGYDLPIQLAPTANDPVIAAGPGGRGPVIAAWESRSGATHTIQCKVLE